MKKTKKRMIIILAFIGIVLIIHTVLYYISHHEDIDYTDVERIEIWANYYDIPPEYTKPGDIKKVLRKIKGINYYKNPDVDRLQESPTANIKIVYKDGTTKEITYAGGIVITQPNKVYWVDLVEKAIFFETLPGSHYEY